MYLNVRKIARDLNWNTYSYSRVKNLLRGIKGNTSKKQIQQMRRLIQKSMSEIDATLSKLENE